MKKLLSVIFVISVFTFISCKKPTEPKTTLAQRAGVYVGVVTVTVTASGDITFATAGPAKHFDPNSTDTRFDYNATTYIVFIDNNSLNFFDSGTPYKCTK